MENHKNKIKSILMLVGVIASLLLVVLNRSPIGIKPLGLQLLGIAGLLTVLYLYNRPFKG